MKKTLFLFLCLMALFANAQNSNYQDVVYLKNGSIIHGMIIEEVPNQIIKIQTKDGNVFVYAYTDIEKITKEPTQKTNIVMSIDTTQWSGYVNHTELFLGFGIAGTYGASGICYGIQTINGFQYKKLFSVGIGIGVDRLSGIAYNTTLMPIFFDVRENLMRSQLTKPYIEFAMGYSVFLSSDEYYIYTNEGGVIINPSIGMTIQVSKKNELNIGLGFLRQQITVNSTQTYTNINGVESVYYNTTKSGYDFITIKLGISF